MSIYDIIKVLSIGLSVFTDAGIGFKNASQVQAQGRPRCLTAGIHVVF